MRILLLIVIILLKSITTTINIQYNNFNTFHFKEETEYIMKLNIHVHCSFTIFQSQYFAVFFAKQRQKSENNTCKS